MQLFVRFVPGTDIEIDLIESRGSRLTIQDVLDSFACFPDDSVDILLNGTCLNSSASRRACLQDCDTLTVLSRVRGGSTMVVERTYRGISPRIAIHYLCGLGGEQVDERTVKGEQWRADISSRTVTIGPTLKLTEVRVRFEGLEDDLETLIDAFSRKAARAGG